jgi:repressor LexA
MLTAKQHQTYCFVCDYIQENGYAPTDAEIAKGIGIKSRGVAHRYVKALETAGLLNVVSGRRRNIRLTNVEGSSSLPLRGKIAAGSPLEVLEQDGELDVASTFLGPDRYVLQVSGDSMIGDNICDGDYIVCEIVNSVDKNDIVVAVVDNQETTLKRVMDNSDGTVTLLPSNPNLSPMVYASDRISIHAKYVGLLRVV